jgi:hypothetical protein
MAEYLDPMSRLSLRQVHPSLRNIKGREEDIRLARIIHEKEHLVKELSKKVKKFEELDEMLMEGMEDDKEERKAFKKLMNIQRDLAIMEREFNNFLTENKLLIKLNQRDKDLLNKLEEIMEIDIMV